MSVTRINRSFYKIEVELDPFQYNLLAVALDHMWEHLDSLREEGIDSMVIEDRVDKLKLMQKTFGL
jgi:hypothetical protein